MSAPERERPRRRRPRYVAFLVTGALVGVALAAVLMLGPAGDGADPQRLFAYLATLLAGLGALAGGAVAVLVEGRRGR